MEGDPSHQCVTRVGFAWPFFRTYGVHEYVKEAAGDAPALQFDERDLAC